MSWGGTIISHLTQEKSVAWDDLIYLFAVYDLLAVGTNNLLNQLGLPDELSAGFSISLSLAGFMQMAVGMRLHLKVVRMISLATFSIVLLKLVLVDLWLLPTIGKVVVFIILGVTYWFSPSCIRS